MTLEYTFEAWKKAFIWKICCTNWWFL